MSPTLDTQLKFLIIDDHEVIHNGLKILLTPRYPNIQYESALSGDEALEKFKIGVYDLIVLDFYLPDTEAFNLVRLFFDINPSQKVLIFSMVDESLLGKRLIKMGVSGFVNKNCNSKIILQAVERILAGGKYLSPALANSFVMDESRHIKANVLLSELTERETEVMSLMMKGARGKEIAVKLNLHTSTVGTYKLRIFEKLGVKNILELHKLVEAISKN